VARIRRKMAEAVDLAKLHGGEQVERALGACAEAERFGEGELAAILGKLTPWPIYRLYEEPGLKPGYIKRPVHPVDFITSKTLKSVIEHLP
jgi:hypothetical protein